jgi:hypothetical protein
VFNVQVAKGQDALVFECESDGTFVAINHVSREPKSGVESESMYTVRVSSVWMDGCSFLDRGYLFCVLLCG